MSLRRLICPVLIALVLMPGRSEAAPYVFDYSADGETFNPVLNTGMFHNVRNISGTVWFEATFLDYIPRAGCCWSDPAGVFLRYAVSHFRWTMTAEFAADSVTYQFDGDEGGELITGINNMFAGDYPRDYIRLQAGPFDLQAEGMELGLVTAAGLQTNSLDELQRVTFRNNDLLGTRLNIDLPQGVAWVYPHRFERQVAEPSLLALVALTAAACWRRSCISGGRPFSRRTGRRGGPRPIPPDREHPAC